MRLLSLLCLLLLPLSATGQAKNPFLHLKYDRVVIYDFNGRNETDISIVNSKGKLSGSVRKEAEPDPKMVAELNRRLGEKRSYGGPTASCFVPHLGIVYYLEGKIVGHVSVCFDCNQLRSSIPIVAQQQGKAGTGEHTYYIAAGLSKSFRQFLNSLAVRHDFSHPIAPGSPFDQ